MFPAPAESSEGEPTPPQLNFRAQELHATLLEFHLEQKHSIQRQFHRL